MDQLKIVLEHRFWILSGLVVLLPPIAWMVSTGDMSTQIDTRTKKIQTSVKSLEGVKKKESKTPNKDWAARGAAINVKLAAQVEHAQKALYEHQRAAMVWLPLIRKDLDDSKVKYRADTAPNPLAFKRAKNLFISRYIDMWRPDVYKVIEPFDVTTGEGKVLAIDANGHYTIMRAPYQEWARKQSIAADEMWGAQEDLWMLHALMKAVARVNEGATTIDNAPIRRILKATLRGGSPADLNERRTKKKNQSAQVPGTPGSPGTESQGLGWARGSSLGRLEGDTGPKALAMIDPDDIFGSGEESSTPQASGMKKPGGPSELGVLHPYVEESGRWRSRGFVLRVVMQHQEIPNLLTALSESPFPVQIWQVEHMPYDSQKNRLQVSSVSASENDVDQKRQKEVEERLVLALNQSDLADVLVAGTFILYNEPAGAAEQRAPTSTAPVPAKTAGPAKGSPAAKGAAGAPASAATSKPPQSAGTAPKPAAPASAPSPAKGASPKAGPGTPQPPNPAPAKAPGTPAPATAKPAAAKS